MNGGIELAEMCFEMPVRQGLVPEMTGLTDEMMTPSWATSVGLLLHGFRQQCEGGYNRFALGETASGAWIKMKQWFRGNF